MQMLPGMVVINTCDYNQTKAATLAVADYDGPVYLRFGRPKVSVFMPEDAPFYHWKSIAPQRRFRYQYFCTGHLVEESLKDCDRFSGTRHFMRCGEYSYDQPLNPILDQGKQVILHR